MALNVTFLTQRNDFQKLIVIGMMIVLGLLPTVLANAGRYMRHFTSNHQVIYSVLGAFLFGVVFAVSRKSKFTLWLGRTYFGRFFPAFTLSPCRQFNIAIGGIAIPKLVRFFAILTRGGASIFLRNGFVKICKGLFFATFGATFAMGYTTHDVNSLLVDVHATRCCNHRRGFCLAI